MENWDDLRIFLAVARAQRMAGAARALGVDVTTVGRRLARLEQRLGTAIFETIGGERRLTETGQALLVHSETIEAAVLAATEVDPTSAALAGQVRLSIAEGLATYIVAPALPAFRRDQPNLRIDLITASGFLNPSRREADMAVMLARPRNRQLRATKLSDYRLRLYATPGFLADHARVASAADLHGHALISYVPEHVQAPELNYLSEIHDGLVARARSTSITVQHAMIRAGAGIGVLPDFIATRDAALVPVLGDSVHLTRTFWLVTHQDTHATPRIQAVGDWLRGLAETLA